MKLIWIWSGLGEKREDFDQPSIEAQRHHQHGTFCKRHHLDIACFRFILAMKSDRSTNTYTSLSTPKCLLLSWRSTSLNARGSLWNLHDVRGNCENDADLSHRRSQSSKTTPSLDRSAASFRERTCHQLTRNLEEYRNRARTSDHCTQRLNVSPVQTVRKDSSHTSRNPLSWRIPPTPPFNATQKHISPLTFGTIAPPTTSRHVYFRFHHVQFIVLFAGPCYLYKFVPNNRRDLSADKQTPRVVSEGPGGGDTCIH